MSFSEWLQKMRGDTSLRQFSLELGFDPNAVRVWLYHDRIPTGQNLMQICQRFASSRGLDARAIWQEMFEVLGGSRH